MASALLSLALLRIAVAGLVLTSSEVWSTMALEALTPALRTPPEGLGWFAAHAPITEPLIDAARLATALAAASALVGYRSRTSFAVLAVTSFYLFACSELVGAARHDMHLFWFTALLAVSPCGARLAIDARKHVAADPFEANVALWTARAFLAVVYFFPGYWKLRSAGLHWALGDNLKNQMYWKWFENAWTPAFPIDRYPSLVRAGALSVLLLELGFPFLILTPIGRLAAATGGVAFHVFANVFMRLGFSSLWWCYGVLVDPERVARWLHDDTASRGDAPDAPEPSRATHHAGEISVTAPRIALVFVSVVLLGGNVVQGFRGAVQAWPFACYPTFQYEARATIPDLVVTAALAGSGEATLYAGTRGAVYRSQRDWGTAWKLMGEYGEAPAPSGLVAFYERLVAEKHALRPPPGATALRFYRAEFSVMPADRGRNDVSRREIGEVPLRTRASPLQ